MSKYESNINLSDKNSTFTKIFERVQEKSEVLDVGCASGYFAEILSKEKNCTVIGIEIDERDAERATRFCKFVLKADIESLDWEEKLKNKKFDHIIFADVLEHLKDPGAVLKRVKRFLKPKGTILISIPNIAHVSIRLELLQGKFIPEEIGILDNTHLKYFTRDSFINLAQTAGYAIRSFSASIFDFPEAKIKEILLSSGFSPDVIFVKNS